MTGFNIACQVQGLHLIPSANVLPLDVDLCHPPVPPMISVNECQIAESLIDGSAGKPNSAFPGNVPIVPERKMNMSTLKAEARARDVVRN